MRQQDWRARGADCRHSPHPDCCRCCYCSPHRAQSRTVAVGPTAQAPPSRPDGRWAGSWGCCGVDSRWRKEEEGHQQHHSPRQNRKNPARLNKTEQAQIWPRTCDVVEEKTKCQKNKEKFITYIYIYFKKIALSNQIILYSYSTCYKTNYISKLTLRDIFLLSGNFLSPGSGV